MRGKETIGRRKLYYKRITPAYAGKSLAESGKTLKAWDHPRLCGEKSYHNYFTGRFIGSPPPMRGKGCKTVQDNLNRRITPAYAGKRPPEPPKLTQQEDHPRLCGEKVPKVPLMLVYSGSPPPMRGKVKFLNCHIILTRITPAYAGKSSKQFGNLSKPWDHPRLCGEKTKKIPKQRYFFHQPASFSFSLQYT